jgi:uncharacterized membrane protein YeaQ/YmgE (transglycosylase-associated protein family)
MEQRLKALAPILILGLAAGFLASFIVPGNSGLLRYLISGVIGALIGGYLLDALKINLGIKNPLASQLATATIGAVAVLLLAKIIG